MSVTELNVELFHQINDLGKEYSVANPAIIFIAEYMVYVLALIVLVIWFTRVQKNRVMVISAGIAFIVAEILGKVAGKLHSNQQPFAELANVNQLIEKAVDNSFPSDHTILFFSFCFTFFLFGKRLGVLWILLACLVGVSRIWVGVHYPADVAVGAFIAMVSAFVAYLVVPKLKVINQLLAFYEKIEQMVLPTKMKTKDF
ncbi:undecaprenyl-diphosphatase [Fredinandcohnia humi]